LAPNLDEEHEPSPRRYSRWKLTESLQAHLKEAKVANLKAGRKLPAWVFATLEGTHLDGDNVRHRVFYRLLTSAKLREIWFHDLRHTFASLLIQNGEPLTYVEGADGAQFDPSDCRCVRTSGAERIEPPWRSWTRYQRATRTQPTLRMPMRM